jgi:hypothetical protein
MARLVVAALVAIPLIAAGCASDPVSTTAAPTTESAPTPNEVGLGDVADRLDEISAAVAAWSAATDIAAAHHAAEEARNLIVGEAGPYFGDADGDGVVAGASPNGLLPGLDGTSGIAPLSLACLERDVLGGEWDDPIQRWQILDDAIAAWASTNNTFPSLPSHPMRVIGWATLTLASDNLETARQFAGHARLHVDISLRALNGCP